VLVRLSVRRHDGGDAVCLTPCWRSGIVMVTLLPCVVLTTKSAEGCDGDAVGPAS
jgi:hypothetical protein